MPVFYSNLFKGRLNRQWKILEECQPIQEHVRGNLLLLQDDVERKKQQQEVHDLADASDNEAAKDDVGVSLEEDAKSPKVEAGLAEEDAPDQHIETATKVLTGEKSAATLHDLHMLNSQEGEEKHKMCHYITRATNASSEEMARIEEAERWVEKRKQAWAEWLLKEEEEWQIKCQKEDDERKRIEALELEEEQKELQEPSRQRDSLRVNEEKALQKETLQTESKKENASVSFKDFCMEVQSQMAFLLNQQVMMQQNFSVIFTEIKTALCDIAVQVQKPNSPIEQEIPPRTSMRMGDAPHSSPLTESAVSYIVPPQPLFFSTYPRLQQHPLRCCRYQLSHSLCNHLCLYPSNLLRL